MRRRGHAEGGCHRHAGTVAGTVERALRLRITGGGDAYRFIRPYRRHTEGTPRIAAEPVSTTQLAARARKQRVLLGAAQIRDTDAGRVALPAGGARGDEGLFTPPAVGDQRRLDPRTVDTVQHPIGLGNQQRGILDGDKRLDRIHAAGRIDVMHPLAQDLDLGAPQGGLEGG